MNTAIVDITSTASVAITLFGMVFCLMQTQNVRLHRTLALFFAAVTLSNMPDGFKQLTMGIDERYLQLADLVIWFPSTLCLAPLFWIYVHTLTSATESPPRNVYRHFLLPALSAIFGLIVAAVPNDTLTLLFANPDLPFSGGALALALIVILLQLAVFPQIAIYLFLIVRRMIRFRILLRDVYASTEKHELRWIAAIGGLGAVYWGTGLLLLTVHWSTAPADITAALLNLGSISALALVATIALWGIRQRPPLVPDADDPKPADHVTVPPSDTQGGKYEKSALGPEASRRIANKLRAAMEADKLHRDPNLSLWALARHIGASPNYISQTLNEVIGESFFDFVNGYRIAEAMTLLSTTSLSVLTITYDVGFNARSSFYNAFKRVSGQTPTAYRKTMSQPTGVDDLTA